MKTIKKGELLNAIEHKSTRSAWSKGVKKYACEVVDAIETDAFAFESTEELKRILLNGARDWAQYSEGGCALVYNQDIAERLLTPSELRKFSDKFGNLKHDDMRYIRLQAQALTQAWMIIRGIANRLAK